MTPLRPRLRLGGFAVLGAGLLAMLGCATHGLEHSEPSPCCDRVVSVPQSSDRAVDVLFVIDNSGSMADENALLQAQFSALFQELRSLPGDLPDLHLGVISTDLGAGDYGITYCEAPGGDGGRLLTGNCTNPEGARFLVDVAPAGCEITRDAQGLCVSDACAEEHCRHEGSATLSRDATTGCPRCRNYAGQYLDDVVSCIAGLGSFGCGFEQPLEALRLALSEETAANAGFLRERALLAIFIVTNEDDCSAADPRLFDPSETAIDSPLGPLTAFRCFEFGVTCDMNDRTALGARTGCVPREDPGALLHPVSRYVDLLRGLKDDQMLVLAAVAGPVHPSPTGVGAEVTVVPDDFDQPEVQFSCTTERGGALPGIRLRALVEELTPQESLSWAYSSRCAPTFTDALQGFGREIGDRLSSPCLPAPLRGCVDPGAEHGAPRDAYAGNDVCLPRCAVTDVLARGTPEEARRDVPSCLEVCPEGACPGNVDRALAYAGGHPPLRDPGLPVEACFHVGWNPRCEASHFGELLVARRFDPPPRTFAEVGCAYTQASEFTCNDGLDNDEDGLVDLDDPDCQ